METKNKSTPSIKNLEREIKHSNKTIRNIMEVVNDNFSNGNESKKELRDKMDRIIRTLNSHYDQV